MYQEVSDPRRNAQYILKRNSGMDFRVVNNMVSIWNQQGGVLGEDLILDYW